MAKPVQTGLRLHNTTPFRTTGHLINGLERPCDHGVPRATLQLRLIGWLDQQGNVWLSDRDWMEAGGPNGSITPLLINPSCDG